MTALKPASAGRKTVLVVLIVGGLVSFAAGGRVGKPALEAQLGSRFLTSLPQDMKAGQTAEAVINDPSKLAKFGLANLKRGDKIRLIKEAGESNFTVEVTQRVNLTVDAKGALRKLGR